MASKWTTKFHISIESKTAELLNKLRMEQEDRARALEDMRYKLDVRANTDVEHGKADKYLSLRTEQGIRPGGVPEARDTNQG